MPIGIYSIKNLKKEEAKELLKERMEQIRPDIRLDTQTERGRLFEF